jgi:hydrogenase maturation protease
MASFRFDLLDILAGAERLVVVDALAIGMGAEPGMCTVADVTDLPAAVASVDCIHRAAVSDVIDLARQVSCEGTLQNVTIAAVEGKRFLDCGGLFSDEVVAATPRLVDLILLAIGAKVEARAMVKDACRRFSASSSVVLRSWRYEEVRADVTGL